MATILVVDDTYSSREPVARLLRFEGHTAYCAASGREALELLNQIEPDLILLDLMMPEMDGVGFLMHLKRDARHCHLPVVVLTALRYGDTVDQAKALGVKDVLLKAQFTFKDLMQVIRRHLQKVPAGHLPPAAIHAS